MDCLNQGTHLLNLLTYKIETFSSERVAYHEPPGMFMSEAVYELVVPMEATVGHHWWDQAIKYTVTSTKWDWFLKIVLLVSNVFFNNCWWDVIGMAENHSFDITKNAHNL